MPDAPREDQLILVEPSSAVLRRAYRLLRAARVFVRPGHCRKSFECQLSIGAHDYSNCTEGTFEYSRALPVPRTAQLAAETFLWLATALPGLVASLLVGAFYFDLNYRISIAIIPAVLVVALSATALGYAVAYLLSPMATSLVSQLLVFFTLMFSPINFPAERLPGWLQGVHSVLPFESMAQMIREALISPAAGPAIAPYALVALWCAAGLFGTYRVMIRRS